MQTFYRHFQGKDELLLAIIEESVTARTAIYREQAAGLDDAVARLELFVNGPFSTARKTGLSPMIVREHLRLMERYAREVRAADDSYRELLKETIEAAQAGGRFPGVDAADESELIMALVLTRYHNLVLGVVSRTPAEEGRHIWSFCLAALSRCEHSGRAVPRGARRTSKAKEASTALV